MMPYYNRPICNTNLGDAGRRKLQWSRRNGAYTVQHGKG